MVVRIEGAPETVRIAAALLTVPDEATMCEMAEASAAFWATPEPLVTTAPSELQVIGAVKGLLN